MSLTPGVVVNGYRIEAEIGRGGMAVVYRAHQVNLRRDVALKMLLDSYGEHPELRARFTQEALAVARLRHPAILVIYDVGEYQGMPYLLTELIEGGTLAALLGTPQPLDRVVRLLRPIAAALDHAHGRGILHRDVKPSNILLRRDGAPVLADFGLARAMEGDAGLTRTGLTLGTPAYMAPEQAMGSAGTLTPAADRYALAVVAYELLTGAPPFSGPTPFAVAMAQVQQPPPPPRSLNPAIPAGVEAALLKGLAKAPEDRYSAAVTFVEALAAGEPVAEPATEPPTVMVEAGMVQAALRAADVAPATPATLVADERALQAMAPAPPAARPPGSQPAGARLRGRRRSVLTASAGLVALIGITAAVLIVRQLSTAPATAVPAGRQLLASLPIGYITTYAGGLTDAHGAPTSFSMLPQAVALAGRNALLIADGDNGIVWLANRSNRELTLYGRTIAAGQMAIVAGNVSSGFSGDGGPATQAGLAPVGVAVDGAGNLYIADASDNRVREVHAGSGTITTVAGNGQRGFSGDGGPAIRAKLGDPEGVAVDSAGNLYIADASDNRVREVHAGSGIITAVAGTGQRGFSGDGGPATQAKLAYPDGVAVDSAGNLYIADFLNNRVREVHAGSGIITTVAGTGRQGFSGDGGPATQATLNHPNGVAVDSAGSLFITDGDVNFIQSDQRVRRVDARTGIITTVAGKGYTTGLFGEKGGFSGDGGPATQARLNYPNGAAVDSAGNLYIADALNDRVREVHAGSGIITTVAGPGQQGSGEGGPAPQAGLSPEGVAADSAGNLYILDSGWVREVHAGSGTITTVAGQAVLGPGGLAVDSVGNLYIADASDNRVREVHAGSGIITAVAGTGQEGYSGDGGPAAQAKLAFPRGVAVDSAGNLYIADFLNRLVRGVHAGSGTITTVAGTGSVSYSGDGGPATQAGLVPAGVAVDSAGNLYIADVSNSRVREVHAGSGTITTVAGNGQRGFSGDGGPAIRAKLGDPEGVAVDSAGNLYIADASDNRVREVHAGSGTITTVAGNGGYGYSGDRGPATQAALDQPWGVAVDSAGNLYIMDQQNHRVRVVRGVAAPAR